mmetsp:Transcript_88684/g.264597  ORF Transcript_88684/g.264597 Transcript_88684/m.264597 type:complete len:344 (-) Transcript_88684:1081-2112(-)
MRSLVGCRAVGAGTWGVGSRATAAGVRSGVRKGSAMRSISEPSAAVAQAFTVRSNSPFTLPLTERSAIGLLHECSPLPIGVAMQTCSGLVSSLSLDRPTAAHSPRSFSRLSMRAPTRELAAFWVRLCSSSAATREAKAYPAPGPASASKLCVSASARTADSRASKDALSMERTSQMSWTSWEVAKPLSEPCATAPDARLASAASNRISEDSRRPKRSPAVAMTSWTQWLACCAMPAALAWASRSAAIVAWSWATSLQMLSTSRRRSCWSLEISVRWSEFALSKALRVSSISCLRLRSVAATALDTSSTTPLRELVLRTTSSRRVSAMPLKSLIMPSTCSHREP